MCAGASARGEPAPYGAMIDVLDELRLGERRRGVGSIRVAIPTEREMAQYWASGL